MKGEQGCWGMMIWGEISTENALIDLLHVPKGLEP